MEKTGLKTSAAQRKASAKWQKENYSRIPLDVSKGYHAYLKEIATKSGMTLGAFIKEAITEKIIRDGLKPFEGMSSPD